METRTDQLIREHQQTCKQADEVLGNLRRSIADQQQIARLTRKVVTANSNGDGVPPKESSSG